MKTLKDAAVLCCVLLGGCIHSADPYRTKGQVVDDRKLTGEIKGALDDSPVYKFPHVRVMTYNGAAQLSGFVMKETQRREAVELARNIPGVKEVINNISLAQPGLTQEATVRYPVYGPQR